MRQVFHRLAARLSLVTFLGCLLIGSPVSPCAASPADAGDSAATHGPRAAPQAGPGPHRQPPLARANDDRVIRLTSLDWPPYSGEQLAQQGASVAIVRAAAEAMGYTLEVRFLPWVRAIAVTSQGDSGFVGYFPEYFSDAVAARFVLSDPIGSGPLGFAERREAAVTWNRLSDLKPLRIGTVRGYVNTAEFDALVASGELQVEAVKDDVTNLRKLAGGRVPLAVIDRNVMTYLLANDPAMKAQAGQVQFNARLLEDKALFIAFQRTAAGEEAARIINAGLKKIDAEAIAAPFFD